MKINSLECFRRESVGGKMARLEPISRIGPDSKYERGNWLLLAEPARKSSGTLSDPRKWEWT